MASPICEGILDHDHKVGDTYVSPVGGFEDNTSCQSQVIFLFFVFCARGCLGENYRGPKWFVSASLNHSVRGDLP